MQDLTEKLESNVDHSGQVSSFPSKLSRLIKSWSHSQRELSQRTGLAQSAISEMARGNRRPYLDQAFKLAKAFEVSLDYLADDSKEDIATSRMTSDEETILRVLRSARIPLEKVLVRLSGPRFVKAGNHIINKDDVIKITKLRKPILTLIINIRYVPEPVEIDGPEAEAFLGDFTQD